ncbi:SRPBCC family protein [Rhizobium johnstonii]|jgi:hypothetical protein|uniref:SRPBCC family protein n=1 Tax=Rhizobium TaxID=379 RepID=UPI00140FE7D1|nr:SRPBCC family protein [Rhizobium leguminosarum]QIO64043.1 SRPBCC family protein [Rhizobium leguminosarum bv. trifolii]
MANIGTSIDLDASADEIWAVIGGFGSLPDWIPTITSSELREGGRVRNFNTSDGANITERLMAFDEVGHSYTYAIVQGPIPVTGYLSTLRVKQKDGGKGSAVEWVGNFTPSGVSVEEATKIVFGIYDGGLTALTKRFAPNGASVA